MKADEAGLIVPGSAMASDAFRPFRLPLVFALLQLGFIGGTSLGVWGGGRLIAWTATWPETGVFMGLTVHNWQWIMVMVGPPGLLAFVLYINRFQIKPEERTLSALFGGEYGAYQERVRRWL